VRLADGNIDLVQNAVQATAGPRGADLEGVVRYITERKWSPLMGMFDDVRCEVPLPDGWEAGVMQTKDLDCELAKYVIRSDGRLVKRHPGAYEEAREYAEDIDLNFHGILNFYGYDAEKEWHEYNAKFTDGTLVKIDAVEEKK